MEAHVSEEKTDRNKKFSPGCIKLSKDYAASLTPQEIFKARFLILATPFFTLALILFLISSPVSGIVGKLIAVLALLSFFFQMAQISHETSHMALFDRGQKKLHVLVGTLSSSFMGFTFSGYEKSHHDHHIYLNTDKDGDIGWYQTGMTRKTYLKFLIQDLLGITAINRAILIYVRYGLNYIGESVKSKKIEDQLIAPIDEKLDNNVFFKNEKLLVILAQLTMLGVFSYFSKWENYFIYYVGTLFTLYPTLVRIRTMGEHVNPNNDDYSWISRTYYLNIFEKMIIGPYFAGYHLEHHLYPSVPCYKLPLVREYLSSQAKIDLSAVTGTSYFKFLYKRVLTCTT